MDISESSNNARDLFTEMKEDVERGDAVSALLQAGADPESVEDADDPTLLMRTAEGGRLAVVKVLVEGGANVNAESEDCDLDRRYGEEVAEAVPGGSALLCAGLKNHREVYDYPLGNTEPELRRRVEQIFKTVKRLKAPRANKRGAKALCEAALRGDLEAVRSELAAGTDVNAQDRSGPTALLLVAALGHVEIVALLLEAGADVGIATNEGLSAIHCAKDPVIIQALPNGGADPNAVSNYGHRPLHFTLGRGQDEGQVRCLLSAGADVNAANDLGETPLHRAVEVAPPEVVALLVKEGADIHSRTERGTTPFEPAWGRRDRDASLAIIETLRRAGAVPGEVRQLLAAALAGDRDKVRDLLSSGVDVDQREAVPADPSLRQTPLHAASQAGHAEIVRDLLAAGADVAAKTFECGGVQRSGATPLRLAAAAGHVNIVRILAKAGADADANATWAIEKTPRMEAAKRGDAKMVQALLAVGADRADVVEQHRRGSRERSRAGGGGFITADGLTKEGKGRGRKRGFAN